MSHWNLSPALMSLAGLATVSQTGARPGAGGEPFLISLILAAPGLAGSYLLLLGK